MTILDVCLVSCGSAKNNNLQDVVHTLFKFLVDEGFVCFGECAEVDAERCAFIKVSHKVLIDVFCKERHVRCDDLGKS